MELPAGTLKNEGTEVSPEEAEEIVAEFQASRREHGVAFLQGVAYRVRAIAGRPSAHRDAADVATEVARLFNVPVAMIGASPSGGASALLYANLSPQLSSSLRRRSRRICARSS